MISIAPVTASPDTTYCKPSNYDLAGSGLTLNNPTNAYDLDTNTYADSEDDSGTVDWIAYNTTTGSISQVDLHYVIETGGYTDDTWELSYAVGTSSYTVLRSASSDNIAKQELTYTDLSEPNDGSWSWSDVENFKARFEHVRAEGKPDKSYAYHYEIWLVVTYSAGQNYVADLTQSISSTQSIATETDYNIVPSQSLTTSWDVLTQWNALTTLTQTITSSWDILLSHGMFVDLSQSVTSAWQVLTQTAYNIIPTQAISTTWQTLIQSTFNIIPTLSLTNSWNILIQSTFNVITSLSNTFSWAVDIIYTAGGQQYIVDLSQAISTSWNILIQWEAVIDLSQSVSTTWIVTTKTTFNVVTSLSQTFTWTIDIIKETLEGDKGSGRVFPFPSPKPPTFIVIAWEKTNQFLSDVYRGFIESPPLVKVSSVVLICGMVYLGFVGYRRWKYEEIEVEEVEE